MCNTLNKAKNKKVTFTNRYIVIYYHTRAYATLHECSFFKFVLLVCFVRPSVGWFGCETQEIKEKMSMSPKDSSHPLQTTFTHIQIHTFTTFTLKILLLYILSLSILSFSDCVCVCVCVVLWMYWCKSLYVRMFVLCVCMYVCIVRVYVCMYSASICMLLLFLPLACKTSDSTKDCSRITLDGLHRPLYHY